MSRLPLLKKQTNKTHPNKFEVKVFDAILTQFYDKQQSIDNKLKFNLNGIYELLGPKSKACVSTLFFK